MRRILVVSRWSRAVIGLLIFAMLAAACSVLIDREKNQCQIDADCAAFAGVAACRNNVCVDTGLGPEGCFRGTPTTPEQFANQCSAAQCVTFDNCARLGLCGASDTLPGTVAPPDAGVPIDATMSVDAAVPVDAAAPPPMIDCIDPATRSTVVVGGSTAVQPFLSVIAPLLADDGFQIAYQPSGSCAGVDGMFSDDPSRLRLRDRAGQQAVLYSVNGVAEPCTFANAPATATLDVAASDVYASSCTAGYGSNTSLAEYLGPIQPMTFVVHASSTETAISAEMGYTVFGRGSTDQRSMPYNDPSLYFIRNRGSGTQQMLARAINVGAERWWGIDRGGSSAVSRLLIAVQPNRANAAVGILSTDFADKERQNLRILAFKGTGQSCAYYPDSSQFTQDKANVRDGHYPIWGPIHFYTQPSGSAPNQGVIAFINLVAPPRLDKPLLDAIIKSGLVPQCAMKVQRKAEMGPITAFSPEFQCGCYFEANVPGGTPPANCQVCAGPADCPSDKMACNLGYCEEK